MKLYQLPTIAPNNAQIADSDTRRTSKNPHALDHRLGVAYGVLTEGPLTEEQTFRKVHEYFEKSDLDPLGKMRDNQPEKSKAKPDGGYGGASKWSQTSH
ncbi:hypothetical protein RRF57_003097 [Xylaria bambusicola]|uniref:Uncharacterized protein n=1 Tax=Xylaria bambusicola TaxID=326684 RepID=A0AAN7Z327_9PEZI